MNTEDKKPLTVGTLRRFFATLPEGSDDVPFGVALEVEDGAGVALEVEDGALDADIVHDCPVVLRACAVFSPALVSCKKDTGLPCLPHDEDAEQIVVVGTY